jgi:hypothetical protein
MHIETIKRKFACRTKGIPATSEDGEEEEAGYTRKTKKMDVKDAHR